MSGVSQESFQALGNDLCSMHVRNRQRSYLVQAKDKDAVHRRLKKTFYNSFFLTVKGPQRRISKALKTNNELNSSETILAHVYEMRRKRRYDDANRLEQCLGALINKDGHGCDPSVMATLCLLVRLAGTTHQEDQGDIGSCIRTMPVVPAKQNLPAILPSGPRCYGDTNLYINDNPYYMHYPRSIFEKCDLPFDNKTCVFQMSPGSNLQSGSLFNAKNVMAGSTYPGSSTLFGGLVSAKSHSIDVRLDLPDLPDSMDPSFYEIRVPKPMQSGFGSLSEDTGFNESVLESPSNISAADSAIDDDIWDLALKHEPCKHYTWETIGSEPRITERHFMTEAGPEALNEWFVMRQKELSVICPNITLPPRVLITRSQLIKDTINLLLGVPSHTFCLDQTKFEFVLKEGIFLSGTTQLSVQQLMSDFVETANGYVKLNAYSSPPTMDSFYTKGLVFQAFTNAIQRVLQHYRALILRIPADKTLLELKFLCNKLFTQMRFLIKLCKCSKDHTDKDPFPTGIPLITYLYQETLESCNTDQYPMMLSLLLATSEPYTLFVHDWVFHGVFRDVYGEFMIQMNEDQLQFRDKHYWTQGYTLRSSNVESNVPFFLSNLAKDIFVCGKSINLLRAFCPNHFMCNVDDSIIPRVKITFSEEELSFSKNRCEIYTNRMKQIAKQVTTSRQEMHEKAEQAKHDLIIQARQGTAKELHRMQAKIVELKTAVNAKKQRDLTELKTQMELAQQRRAAAAEDDKEQDKAYIAMVTRQEEAMTVEETELEQRAREEVIEYYAKLTEEAARREQKALWKVKRAQLAQSRVDFLMKAETQWQAELDIRKELEEAGLDITDSNLPEWAQRSMGTLHVTEAEDHQLPKWIVKEPFTGHVHDDTGELPNWAIRGLEKKTDSPVIVNEESRPQWATTGADEEPRILGDTADVDTLASQQPAQGINVISSGIKGEDVLITREIKLNPQYDENLPTWAIRSIANPDQLPLIIKDDAESQSTADLTEMPTKNCEDELLINIDREPSLTTMTDSKQVFNPSSIKTTIKIQDAVAITQESVIPPERPQIKGVSERYTWMESEPVRDVKPQVKISSDINVNEMSAEAEQRPHIKFSDIQHASVESLPVDGSVKSSIKSSNQMSATKESENEQQIPKRMKIKEISEESSAMEWKVKKTSTFGHPSELSNDIYEITAPKLKRNPNQHANQESDWRSFTIKPQIKRSKTMSATTESQESDRSSGIPRIKGSRDMFATKESDWVDMDARRLQKFRTRNIYGHASDSSIQKLLYGKGFGASGTSQDESLKVLVDVVDSAYPIMPGSWMDSRIEAYQDNFDVLNLPPQADLMSRITGNNLIPSDDYRGNADADIDASKYGLLPAIIKKSIIDPLSAQISLVNQCIVNYFLVDLTLEEHFVALHRFLLMADGEFCQILSDHLFDKLSTNPRPQEILNPMFLNGILTKALRSSMHMNDKYADRLSFVVKHVPYRFHQNAHDTLDCLEFCYSVDWPVNIVITDNCMLLYNKVFSYMLQLKRVVWVLKDVWHRLKRDAIINKAMHASQFRQLQLYRQEMQHFVKVMQGYITNQIIHVTWQEFHEALDQHIHNLDDLHHVHAAYIQKALFRCLLNKKAAPVMKVICDIFCLILKFRTQLVSSPWVRDPNTGEVTHAGFSGMVDSYKAFRQFSVFLFKVVSKLSARGYQPHLQEFLLRLNFNNYYKDS